MTRIPLPGHVVWNVAWIVATTIGLVIGGLVLHFPGSFGEPDWQPFAMVFGAILGFMTGLAIGVIQWAGLLLGRRAGMRLLLWMGVGIAVTHGLNDGAPWSLGLVAVSALSGLGMAAAYAACLEDRRPIPITLVGFGWAVGLVLASVITDRIGLPSEQTPVGWASDHAAEGLIAGLVWGATTVIARVPARLRGGLAAVGLGIGAMEGAAP